MVEADVILHVRDATHEDTAAQAHDVEEVLRALDIDPNDRTRLIEVWNKIDRLDARSARAACERRGARAADDRPVLVSALTGEGLDACSMRSRRGSRRDGSCSIWCSIRPTAPG